MILTIFTQASGEQQIDSPSADDISQAVKALANEECVMLSKDDTQFIQAVWTAGQGLVLEYQEGDTDSFYVARGEYSIDDTIQALIAYQGGGETWRDGKYDWEQVNLLAYLDADLTMLTYMSAEALEQGGVVDFEEFYEMPCIGMHQLITLYQLLCGGEYDELEGQFDLLGEADMEEYEALLHLVPEPFFLALEQATPGDLPELAQRWWESEYFPQAVASPEEVVELLSEMVSIAKNSAASSSLLIICEVELGDEEMDAELEAEQ